MQPRAKWLEAADVSSRSSGVCLPHQLWRHLFLGMGAIAIALLLHAETMAKPPAPTGQWSLEGRLGPEFPHGPEGKSHGVTFGRTTVDKIDAARFDGKGAYAEFPEDFTNRGKNDFTFSVWINATNDGLDDPGDIASAFDPKTRHGWSLSLKTQAGVTNSQVSVRQLQFGIDNGSTPEFRDEGRPGNSLYGFSICVFEDHLYVGTCEPGSEGAGRVFRYDGPGKWFDCGSPDSSNSVSSMAVHNGKLFVGTGKYRLAGSSLKESENPRLGGAIFEFGGPGTWLPRGRLPDAEAVGGMVVYGKRLLATSLYKPAGIFAWQGDSRWERLENPKEQRTQSLTVYDGHLWATSYDGGNVFRYDGSNWIDFGTLESNTQNYSWAVFQRLLHVGSWPSGKVYRWNGRQAGEVPGRVPFDDTGRLGGELEVMGMLVHNGALYAGTLPLAELYRFDGDGQWTRMKQLDETPDVKYRRVWTGATYGGRAYWTTLPSGHVISMNTGLAASVDHALPDGWQHVTAVKRTVGNTVRVEIYINGKLSAQSEAAPDTKFDVANKVPLRLGSGPGDSFRGAMRDVKWYAEALSPADIAELAETRP